jgi:hypothetical protein
MSLHDVDDFEVAMRAGRACCSRAGWAREPHQSRRWQRLSLFPHARAVKAG